MSVTNRHNIQEILEEIDMLTSGGEGFWYLDFIYQFPEGPRLLQDFLVEEVIRPTFAPGLLFTGEVGHRNDNLPSDADQLDIYFERNIISIESDMFKSTHDEDPRIKKVVKKVNAYTVSDYTVELLSFLLEYVPREQRKEVVINFDYANEDGTFRRYEKMTHSDVNWGLGTGREVFYDDVTRQNRLFTLTRMRNVGIPEMKLEWVAIIREALDDYYETFIKHVEEDYQRYAAVANV